MDWFAVTSYGAYPTATPTDAARAIFAVSYGLLDTAPVGVIISGHSSKWLAVFYRRRKC